MMALARRPCALPLRDPQDHVTERLAQPPQRAQPVDHHRGQPDQAFASLVGLVLVADAAEQERRAGLEGRLRVAMRTTGENLGRAGAARKTDDIASEFRAAPH